MQLNLHFGKFGYIVEADIRGFFDNIDHDGLLRMLEERIDDAAFLNLIRKRLKAWILDTDGKVINPKTGAPQGGIINPVLANLFLHYVFDKWMVRKYPNNPWARYADDAVTHCRTEKEAEDLLEQLDERFNE